MDAKQLRDGEPCNHPGCLSHVIHPCEVCGRIGGKTVAKLTPEQAIEILKFRSKCDYPVMSKQETLGIAALIESLARDAELGRAAVDAIDEYDITEFETRPCANRNIAKGNGDICSVCKWLTFCRLRAEMKRKGGE